MGTRLLRNRNINTAALLLCSTLLAAHAQDLTLTISQSDVPPAPGQEASFWLNALNTTSEKATWTAPTTIQCRLRSIHGTNDVSAQLRGVSAAPVVINPGAFSRREYTLAIPQAWTGQVMVELEGVTATQLLLEISSTPPDAALEPEKKGMVYFLQGRQHAKEAAQYDPDSFFKQHIFGYDPFYFIAGTKSPNAKFQISFKYRLLNDQGWLAQQAPLLRGFHLAYSQTSLWDWNAESAPFFDSSYRPELLYSWDRLIGGAPTNWFRLDIQSGLQHESNGRAGSDSRSMNIAYLRPRITLGKDTGLQLTLIPRVWTYVGDLSDNPDMAEYRGYADLRATFGWQRGLQLSALGKVGERLSQGSVTVDATYPLMQPPYGSFSMYLHAQYFTGYGESLVGYKERSEIFRGGISLYR